MTNANLSTNKKSENDNSAKGGSPIGSTFGHLSDEKLYDLCKSFEKNAILWRRKFEGLLPEVFKRKLYKKKGYNSIFEFAAKLAGLSHEQVRRILYLHNKFEETPILQNLLVSGEVSSNKLERVASLATKENQEILAEQVKILSKSVLEQLVRDEKHVKAEQQLFDKPLNSGIKNGLQNSLFAVPGHGFDDNETSQPELQIGSNNQNLQFKNQKRATMIVDELALSEEVKQKLLELK